MADLVQRTWKRERWCSSPRLWSPIWMKNSWSELLTLRLQSIYRRRALKRRKGFRAMWAIWHSLVRFDLSRLIGGIFRVGRDARREAQCWINTSREGTLEDQWLVVYAIVWPWSWIHSPSCSGYWSPSLRNWDHKGCVLPAD